MFKKIKKSLNNKMFLFFFSKSVDFMDRKKYKNALKLLDYLIKNYTPSFEIFYNKGGAHLGIGKALKENNKPEKALKEFEKALETFHKCFELKPENEEVYYAIGLVYSNMENFQEAVKNYEKVLETMPYHITSLHELIKVFIITEQYERTLETIKYVLLKCSDIRTQKLMLEQWRELILEAPDNDTVEEIREIILQIPKMSEL